jgi:hypothetical protein
MFPKCLIVKLSEGLINRVKNNNQDKNVKTSILMNKSIKSEAN